MHADRTALQLAAVLAVTGILAGCSSPNAYLKDTKVQHMTKVDIMKSATEFDMARQSYFAGDLHKALERIDRSIAMNDQVAKSHVLRGRILIEMSQLDGALDALHTAEALDPESVDAQYYLGLAFEYLTEHEEAIRHYMAAAELDPQDAQYVVATAEVLIDDGRVDEADDYIRSRSNRFDHNAGVRQTLGHIALIEGDHTRALNMFEEARLLAPDDTNILEDLAQCQADMGMHAQAAANLAKLLKDEDLAAQRRDLRHLYARCLVEGTRFVDARNVYVSLTEDEDGAADTEAWIGLGKVATVLNDPFRLRTAARRVANLDPVREEGYLFFAIYHRRRGELEQALRYLELGSNEVANPHSIYALAGVILTEMGRDEDAETLLAAALDADPNNKAVAGMLDTFSDD